LAFNHWTHVPVLLIILKAHLANVGGSTTFPQNPWFEPNFASGGSVNFPKLHLKVDFGSTDDDGSSNGCIEDLIGLLEA
jgi:hypothetical protein